MPTTGQIIRERRERLNLEQAEVAERVGVAVRTVQRWESDERQIDYPVIATKLARLLGLSLDEMAAVIPTGLDLGGLWFARWHTSRDNRPVVDKHELTAVYSYDRLVMNATGDYLWRGECRVLGYELTGTYSSIEVDANNHGALFFWLHPGQREMVGHWVGRSVDSMIGTGWGVLARDPERADSLINALIERGYHNLTEWPQEG